MHSANPLVSDADLDFQLHQRLRISERLLGLEHFSAWSEDSVNAYLDSARRFARQELFPSYREIDAQPPQFESGAVRVHPRLSPLLAGLRELGVIAATRPAAVGGAQLPLTAAAAASLYFMAGNLSAFGYWGLTTGAAHLIEAFGSAELQSRFLTPMYTGRWSGTMALTEPQAGSGLADVATVARQAGDHYLLRGAKIFISGGDHPLTENIVHLVLGRIDGAPSGVKGISLFAVPKLRLNGAAWIPNDVQVTGLIHKIGWRGLPSVALSLGEADDCHGWLVGEPNKGLSYMFQMMNEARLMVGANGIATASVAYQASLAYAKERTQGRPLTQRDPSAPAVPTIAHADVRRMPLRQKAIVEGALSLLLHATTFADLSEHAPDDDTRLRASRLLGLLTPVVKSFPAERGYEANTLAVQIHGGYGYSSEYLPEAWLRDQKLNSIHEGTTGIQGLDLLGRRVVSDGGAALLALSEEIRSSCGRATRAGVESSWTAALLRALDRLTEVTAALGAKGAEGDVEGMLLHSTDYLDAFSTVCIGWQWVDQSAVLFELEPQVATRSPFAQGKLAAAQYWLFTELPKAELSIALCTSGEDSYARLSPDAF